MTTHVWEDTSFQYLIIIIIIIIIAAAAAGAVVKIRQNAS